jgi:sporulation-control protein
MSRLLAEVGIGVASVALIVDAHSVSPGQMVDTKIVIEGGARKQQVAELSVGMATAVENDGDRRLVEFGREQIVDQFSVAAGATKTIETTLPVPIGTPVTTVGDTPVWITAGLDVEWAPNPSERTALTVLLPPHLEAVVDTLAGESFVCLGGTCRPIDILPIDNRHDFVQVLDFQPRGGIYDRDIGTIEIVPTYSTERSDRMTLEIVRDIKSGRLALDHLESPGVERRQIQLTTDTEAATIRTDLLHALDDLLP